MGNVRHKEGFDFQGPMYCAIFDVANICTKWIISIEKKSDIENRSEKWGMLCTNAPIKA